MTDHKQLFGYAAIICSIGFLVRSFMPAYAFNGPTISIGSNPIENYYAMPNLSINTSTTILSNTSSNDFMVTKYLAPAYADSCNLMLDSQNLFVHSTNSQDKIDQYNNPGALNLIVPSGSTLKMKNYNTNSGKNCPYYIEGYYIHTP